MHNFNTGIQQKISNFEKKYTKYSVCLSKAIVHGTSALVYFSHLRSCQTELIFTMTSLAVSVTGGSALIQARKLLSSIVCLHSSKLVFEDRIDFLAEIFTSCLSICILFKTILSIFHFPILITVCLLLWSFIQIVNFLNSQIKMACCNIPAWISSSLLIFISLIYYNKIIFLLTQA